jgi:hypothetical protein
MNNVKIKSENFDACNVSAKRISALKRLTLVEHKLINMYYMKSLIGADARVDEIQQASTILPKIVTQFHHNIIIINGEIFDACNVSAKRISALKRLTLVEHKLINMFYMKSLIGADAQVPEI